MLEWKRRCAFVVQYQDDEAAKMLDNLMEQGR
jgi:hypothetical protein